jgi:glycine dehydrogenase
MSSLNWFFRTYPLARNFVKYKPTDSSWLNRINLAMDKKKCFIGQGFVNNTPNYFLTHTIIKNPKWHSSYAAYQPEISQGRLEMFHNYQNLIRFITNKPHTNTSSLDDCQAAIDAINIFASVNKLNTINLHIDDIYSYRRKALEYYSNSFGWNIVENREQANIKISQSVGNTTGNRLLEPTDILFLDPKMSLLFDNPDHEISIGHLQNYGLPLSSGGPYLGFIAAGNKYLRYLPGKMVIPAVTMDGENCYRLGLQTREQHIRRERAVSNICTNQALMATYTSAWTALNGIDQLAKKYNTACSYTRLTIIKLLAHDYNVITNQDQCTDTIVVKIPDTVIDKLDQSNIEYYRIDNDTISLTLDWSHTYEDISTLLTCFNINDHLPVMEDFPVSIDAPDFFTEFDNELKLMRYLNKLSEKDISIADSMIPLGSCTMKYNPLHIFRVFDQENILITHPLSKNIDHIVEPLTMFGNLLCSLTGFTKFSLAPLSGSHGELISMIAVKKYHETNNESNRKVILLPKSCHGTNAATCNIAGFKIGNVDDINGDSFYEEICKAIEKYGQGNIAGTMITFPNTLGYYDEEVKKSLDLIKSIGGICYMDGANLNSMVGHLDLPEIGFDICHLNLHKTFAVPHGGGGPGAGPILFTEKLHPYIPDWEKEQFGVSRFGNTLANFMSKLYLTEMNEKEILSIATKANSNANLLKDLLKDEFPIVTDKNGNVSHELIVKTDFFQKHNITDMELCKRLIDYGYHPPTVNWPLSKSLMIEPTETETTESIRQFAEDLISIKKEAINAPELIKSAPNNPKYIKRVLEAESDKNMLKSNKI